MINIYVCTYVSGHPLSLFQLFITVMDKLRLEIRAMDEVKCLCVFDTCGIVWYYQGICKLICMRCLM